MQQKAAIAFALVALFVTACGDGSSNAPSNDDKSSMISELVAIGVPEDFAEFFADTERTSSCSSDTNCTFNYIYPNGATRTISMTAIPNQTYTPTADELAMTALETHPVYNARFAATGVDDIDPPDTAQVDLGYFLPTTSIPSNQPAALALFAGNKTSLGIVMAAAGEINGYQININETGTKGASVTIGSLLKHFENLGRSVQVTRSLYATASALSDGYGAMVLSQEIKAWLAELDSLEQCAADPTNPLTQTDPNYTTDAVARVRAARTELKAMSAVRFLNIMDETAAGLTPVTTVLSIPLKQAFAYVEQTLKQSSENLMRDIRASVVSCKPTCPTSFVASGASESQINLSWVGSIGDNVVTGYYITGVGANTTTTAMAWSATGLNKSTNYCYTVSAFNDYGTAENCPEACAQTMGPPLVISNTPYAGSTNVPVTTSVTATFSEAMDVTTISTGTFTLTGSTPVAGSVSYNATTATFTPAGELEKGKTYTATINTGVTDTDGIAMEENFTWSFTTDFNAQTGNVFFNGNFAGLIMTNGTANVSWAQIEDLDDVRKYSGSGTISAHVGLDGCNSVPVTSNLIPESNLLISKTNSGFPDTQAFALQGEPFTVTLTCDDAPVDFSGILQTQVGFCDGRFEPQPISDYAHLTGSYSCASGFWIQDVTWDFNAF